ncbi:MAG: 50S ribosomal protein L4 [Acidobacteriota bacterium]|nr:MAG: 50S ribosomal protein L4 [Acidobacteriota bacterium]
MAEISVVNMKREQVASIDLPDGAYDYPTKRHLLYEAVRHYLACGRRGTHKAKNRVDVRGGGRKPWRQKGTGRSRHGSIRSPLWRSGGVAHGPLPRDYSYRFPKQARRRALASALSDKRREGALLVIDELQLDTPKTKALAGFVRDGLGLKGKTLLVYDGENGNLELASRNHPALAAVRALQLHAFHVLDCETLVMSRAAAEQLGEVLSR